VLVAGSEVTGGQVAVKVKLTTTNQNKEDQSKKAQSKHQSTKTPIAANPIASSIPPTLCAPILIPLAALLFVLDEEEEDPLLLLVDDAFPELALVLLAPAAPAASLEDPDPEDREPTAEGSVETVAHVPPLVVVLGSYAKNATLPEVVSWTRALVEA